jgi:hypothetical protein
MRAFVLASLLAASFLAAKPAQAQTAGLFLPASPSGVGGEDSIETSEGTRCRQSINGSGPYLDMGVVGSSTADQISAGYRMTGSTGGTAYARVTVPLGRRPKRLDCTRLYDLEISRLKREIELLKMAAE